MRGEKLPKAESATVQEDELFLQGLNKQLDKAYREVYDNLESREGNDDIWDAKEIAAERAEATRKLQEAKAALRGSYMAHLAMIDAFFGKRAQQRLTAQDQRKYRQELKRQLQFEYAEGVRLLIYLSPWGNFDDFNSDEGFDERKLYPLPTAVDALARKNPVHIQQKADLCRMAEEMMQGRLAELRQWIVRMYFEGGANMGRGYWFGLSAYEDDDEGASNPYQLDKAEMKKAADALARAEKAWGDYRKAMGRVYNPITGYVFRWAFEYVSAMLLQLDCAHERYLAYLLKGDFGSGE